MHVELSERTSQGLSEKVWHYWVHEEAYTRLAVELDFFASYTRPTTRHKFRPDSGTIYSRLDRRKSVLAKQEVPEPDNKEQRIIDAVLEKIVFKE